MLETIHGNGKNLRGMRFGQLVAYDRSPNRDRAHYVWQCYCLECGGFVDVRTGNLTSGHTKSCGCLAIKYKHGHSLSESKRTPTYRTWKTMIQRCTNPKATGFKNYGGRGIRVCEEWKDFRTFLCDMGERPEGTSIDRINNDGNYEPGNCRWADQRTQIANRRVS